jgi:hypothetical protein
MQLYMIDGKLVRAEDVEEVTIEDIEETFASVARLQRELTEAKREARENTGRLARDAHQRGRIKGAIVKLRQERKPQETPEFRLLCAIYDLLNGQEENRANTGGCSVGARWGVDL